MKRPSLENAWPAGDEESLVALFERTVALQRDKTAFIVREERVSYKELDSAANRAARSIVDATGTANHAVASLLEESVHTAVAMLAILKAGKAYMPLNAANPPARLRFMLDESEAPLIITDAAHAELAATLADGRCVVDLESLDDGPSDTPLGLPLRWDDLACILYTSGSTGQPKGVYNDHRQFYATVISTREGVGLTESDVFLLFGSFAASGPARAALWALIKGATVRIGTLDDLSCIPDVIERERVTLANMGPSILTLFLDSYDGRPLPSLRHVFVAGEPFPKTLLKRFFAALPSGVRITNAFGLSETGPVCSFPMFDMPDLDGPLVPIGEPVGCARVLLVDNDLRQVPPGQTGQIAVVSPGTAQGYWKKPDLTRERFVIHPETGERMCLSGDLGRELPDGQLLHLGREDNRVKIRGWSVDLGEVETALGAHPSVRDAAAAMRGNRLVGYVVAKASSQASASALRRFVASRLPVYMVPFAIVTLDALPLTVSGKFDRQALPAPERHRDVLTNPYVGPRTPVEEALSRVWAERLGLDRVGVDDNFFELGGNSLVAARVISAAAAAFGVGVPVDDFFARPTVAGMATAVVERLASNARIDLEAVLGEIEGR